MYRKIKSICAGLFAIGLFLSAQTVSASSLEFVGSSRNVIEVTPDRNTGLEMIYVVYDVDGVSARYTVPSGQKATWYKYSNLGGGYAVEITDTEQTGNVSVLPKVEGDMGYIIEVGTDRFYFWVTGYKPHEMILRSVKVSDESDCGSTILNVDGYALPIHYYTINGQQRTLSREITVDYYTLEANRDAKMWSQTSASVILESIDAAGNIYLNAPPLCNTRFTVAGDRFMKQWGSYTQARTDNYITPAVDSFVFAEQASRGSDDMPSNEIGAGDDAGLGGSAPAEITFTAIGTDAVIHNEWQFSSDSEFENLTYRFYEPEISYVFQEEGTTYVRYIGSNADGTCETIGETFTVHIGSSELKIPNAFSPGVSEGVNDIWKVSYRSLIEFECHIFNIHGQEIYSFNDPSGGWDGKHNGKFVKPGVYYYVIQALGSDGRRYKKSGDINILGHTRRAGSTGGGTTPTE